MSDDGLERVLRLVAEGRLTAEEAEPILAALDAHAVAAGDTTARPEPADGPPRAIRIEVSESGRKVVNLRVPLSLGRSAIDNIPGLSTTVTERIRTALSSGLRGPIVQVDDDGDGVRISIE